METLTAALQLDISAFSSALTRAGAQVAEFASRVTQTLQGATASLGANTQGAQANQQASNQLSTAYLALAQSISQQTQAYTQTQAASLAYRQEQDRAREATRLAAQEARAAAQASSAWTTAMGVITGLGIATSIHAIVGELKQFVVESVNVAVKLQALQISFTAITGSAITGARTLLELRQMANTLGVDFLSLATNFRNFEAAAQGTKISTQDMKTLFLGASEAARTFGLSSEQTQRLFMALDRMMQTGSINARELRLQFGTALPGGLEIFARAVGVSVQEMFEMTKTSSLLADVELPKLGRALHDEFGEKAKVAAESAQAAFARFGNNMLDVSRTVGNAILTILTPVLNIINKAFDALKALKDERDRAVNQGIGTTSTAPLPALEGGRDLQKQVESARQALEDERQVLQEMNKTKTAGLGGAFPDLDISIANQLKMVKSLETAYESLTKKRDLFLEQQKDSSSGGVNPEQIPFKKQTDAFKTSIKELDQTIAEGDAIRKNFPSSIVGKEGALEAARQKVMAYDKTIAEIGKTIAESGGLKEGLTPALQQQATALDVGRKAAQANVEVLQNQLDAERKAAQEAEAARKKALRDMEQTAKERATITEQMALDSIRVSEGEFEGKRAALEKELEYARKIGVAETTVTEYESMRRRVIAQEEGEAKAKLHDQELAQLREDAQRQQSIQDAITRLKAQGTKSHLDDLAASIDKEHRMLVDKGATEIQLEEHTAAGRGAILRAQTEETQKELQKQQQAWQRLASDIQSTLSSAFEQILSGTFNLWDTIKRAFIKLLAELAAAALTQQIIIPLLVQAVGAGGLSGSGGGSSLGTFGAIAGLAGGAAGTSGTGDGSGGVGDSLTTGLTIARTGNSLSSNLGGPNLLGTGGYGGGLFSSLGSTTLGQLGIGSTDLAPSGVALATDAELTGIGFDAANIHAVGTATAADELGGVTLGELASGISAYATPVVVGIAVGQILAMANNAMGLHGAGSSALAGAGGGAAAGALAGSAVFPGIGTAVGALIGTAVGALGGGLMGLNYQDKQNAAGAYNDLSTLGLSELVPGGRSGVGAGLLSGFLTGGFGSLLFQGLFGGRPEPGFEIKGVQPGQAGYNETQGLTLQTPFAITQDFHQRLGVNYEEFKTNINAGINEVATNLLDAFKGLSPTLQQGLVEPLNQVFLEIANKIIVNGKMDSDKLGESISTFFGTTVPGYFTEAGNTVIKQLQAAGKKLDPVLNAFASVMDTIHKDIADVDTAITNDIKSLHQQQLQLNNALQASSNTLMTALYSPAQSFMFAQQQYDTLKQQFAGGTQQQQILWAPQLAQAATQLLSMSKGTDVLGQDPELVRALQSSLMQDITGFQGQTDAAFSQMTDALTGFQATQDALLQQQADTAQGQIDALTGSLGNLGSVDTVIANSLDVLHQIQAAVVGIMGAGPLPNGDPLVQAQVILLGGITQIGAAQLQVLQDISQKLGGGVPQFAGGSETLPRPTFAMLHAGERVLSAQQNGSQHTMAITLHATGETPSGQDVVNQVADAVVARIVHGAGRLGTIPLVVRR